MSEIPSPLMVATLAAVAAAVSWRQWKRAGERERKRKVFERYELDEKIPFLPGDVPRRLPSPEFEEWETLVDNLPMLNKTGIIRKEVEALQPVDRFKEILGGRIGLLRRAHVVLGFMVHSYVNGPVVYGYDEPGQVVVPSVIGEPFAFVCDELGLPLVCCACTFDTWNWKLNDKLSSQIDLENIDLVSRMTDEPAERGFHLLATAMHSVAGPVIYDLFLCDEIIKARNERAASLLMDQLSQVFRGFWDIMARARSTVPEKSFDTYRGMIRGFHEYGIVLNGEVKRPKGPSAGQSTMFFLFDLALGIAHHSEMEKFQQEMLMYLPCAQREMVLDFSMKMKNCGSLSIMSHLPSYQNAKGQLAKLRELHRNVAVKYIPFDSKGTGNSNFRNLLNESIQATHMAGS